MGRKIHRLVNVSGGKDSTALYLWALERGRPFRAVFADVMNEAPETYEYIARMSERSGGPPGETIRADFTDAFAIRRKNLPIKWRADGISEDVIDRAMAVMHPTGNVFLDVCLLRSGFPSAKYRFCTDQLKIVPMREQVQRPIWDAGGAPAILLGVRADESFARALARPMERRWHKGMQVISYRPLLTWTLDDVIGIMQRHGMPLNPLYERGHDRVGCYPCIFTRKADLARIARHSPEAVDRLEEWERIVEQSARQLNQSTFIRVRAWNSDPKEEITLKTHGIRGVMDWARTSWGGKQYRMEFDDEEGNVQRTWNVQCAGQGLCE